MNIILEEIKNENEINLISNTEKAKHYKTLIDNLSQYISIQRKCSQYILNNVYLLTLQQCITSTLFNEFQHILKY